MSPVCAVDQIWVRDASQLDVPGTVLAGEYEGLQVYEEPNKFDRMFLVGRARAEPDWRALLAVMKEDDFDPATEIVADWLPRGDLPMTESADLGSVTEIERTPNSVRARVDANEDSYLVLSDTFFPGWTATIDGEPVEVFPAYHQFRGIVVPAGTHDVLFEYAPASFRFGLWISTVSMGVFTAISAVILFRRGVGRA